jgi:predicted Zn-dependent peptidase
MNNIETLRLDNGLTIYLYNDMRRHSTFFQFITLFGGLTKDFYFDGEKHHIQDGVSHILEHYIVECNGQGNFLKELGEVQMNTNASTHYNMTRFYFDAVEDVLFGIKTLLNGIYNVSFDKDKLDKLKEPICQEIRGKSDNKFYHSNIRSINNIFNNLSFRSIGGTLEEVEKTTIDDLKLCYEAFYVPSNQFIVIGGNFNRDEVINCIKKFYKDLEITKHDVKLIENKEEKTVKIKEDVLYFPTPEKYYEISFKVDVSDLSINERLDLDFYLMCFYNNYFGITSPLYKELVNKKIITSNINCCDTTFYNYIVISIGTYTSNSDYFKNRVFEVIKNLDCFNEEKFLLDKKSAIIKMILRDENIMSMIMPFVDNIVNFNYPYLDNINDIERLNYNDYVKMISNIDFSNYSILSIENEKKS